MTHQHDMPPNKEHRCPVAADTDPVGGPRSMRVTFGKHFNLSVSLSVSPAFLTFLGVAAGVAGGNFWFLL
ncbi:hypothetical protein ABZX65_07705 [Streptomyces sp. NPDC003300]|uniref:hypothetical protein n=1 Tax=unclassified Streptomyces TaxID=2593676 RepID=UPI0033BA0755